MGIHLLLAMAAAFLLGEVQANEPANAPINLHSSKEGFPWEAITAIGTIILALATWYLARETKEAVKRQIDAQQQSQDAMIQAQQKAQEALFKEQRLAHSVDILMRLAGQWESREMMVHRKDYSKKLLANEKMNDSARKLLSFFETLGVVVRRAGLDPYIVWSEFCWPTKHYYASFADQIVALRARTKDNTLYSQFEWINEELLKIDAKEMGASVAHAKPNRENLDLFFNEECSLLVDA